jgi:demethylmenaquinone methyltransferase/2-methoxy-6-polyprenyl-1,4-benzoquinol methylase
MIGYYAKRAAEYERIYTKPERQTDLQAMKQLLGRAFKGDHVFEVACGTGYWTQFIAKSAASILAIDRNLQVIDLARRKDFGTCRTEFAAADAYLLNGVSGEHTAGFHGFWWSHLPITKIGEFLSRFHSRLAAGAKVVMIDNTYVEGSNTPILREDSNGNTFQLRKLDDGSEHEVMKNFPSDSDLFTCLSGYATDVCVKRLKYFWIVEYRTMKSPRGALQPTSGCEAT